MDLHDGRGEPACSGTATFAPSATLTGTSGQEVIGQEPIVVPLGPAVRVVRLLATDNPGVLPAGWTWSVTFAGPTISPASASFMLPSSAGAARRLSDLVPVRSSRRTQTRRALLAATAAGIGGIAVRSALPPAPAQVAHGSDAAGEGAASLAEVLDRCARLDPLPVPRTIITQFQGGDGFVLTGAAASSDVNDTRPGNFICGSQAATVVTRGDGTTFASLSSTRLRFDTAGKYLAVRYRVSSVANTQTLSLEISSDPEFTNCYRWQFADRTSHVGSGYCYDDQWEQVFLSFADATAIGQPGRASLTAARLRVQDNGKPLTVQWQEISLVSDPRRRFPRGVATICLDDIYATQYTHARPVLQAHGLRATVAVIREAIGLAHSMTLPQLRSLQDELGWEIGCHSDTLAVHRATDLGVPLSVMRSDLLRELAFLGRSGFTGDKVLAYPSGLWNPRVLHVARRNCHAGRLDAFRTQETFPPSNPYKLRACGSISAVPGGRSAAEVKEYVDAAAAHRSWLILIFHKIITGIPVQRTECRLTDFEEIISHLAASGMQVRTIGEVMRLARSA